MTENVTPDIDVEELATARESGVLVDVREADEYVGGNHPGAVMIPMGQLANRMGEIDKTSPVSVVRASATGAA